MEQVGNTRELSEIDQVIEERLSHDIEVNSGLETLREMQGKVINFTKELDDEIYSKTSNERKNILEWKRKYHLKLEKIIRNECSGEKLENNIKLHDIICTLVSLYETKFITEEFDKSTFETLANLTEANEEILEYYTKLSKYGLSKKIIDKGYKDIKSEIEEDFENQLAYKLSVLNLLS